MKNLFLFTFVMLSSIPIKSQTITTLSPTQTSTCAGGNIIVQYETTGTFDLMCTFTAQLSDEWGDFTNPIPIGSVPLNTGVIFGTIPSNTDFGFGYRVRVISSNPYVIGTENPFPPIVITSSAVSANINTDPGNEICEGDSIELSVLPNESYFWSTGDTTQSIFVTQSGTYTVTVTNYLTGCEVGAPPVDIVVHALPNVDLGPDQSRCEGDDVFLDAGSGYQMYSWNNGASQNQIVQIPFSGTFFVWVQDTNGCINGDTTHIQFHPNPQFTLGNDTLLCSNEHTLSVPPVYEHYNWNNGLSFNPSLDINHTGIYYVVVANQFGCQGFDTISIQMFPVPAIELGNPVFSCLPPVILNGGDNIAGYNWNNGDGSDQYYYVQTTGMQHITITDTNGCSASDSIYVGIFGIPSINLGQLIVADYNDTIVLDAGAGMLNYLWSNGDTTQTTTIFAANYIAGIYFYSVTVTGDYGCTNSDEVVIQIMEPESAGYSELLNLRVYPNPFSEILLLDCETELTATLRDISGKDLLQIQSTSGIHQINTEHLSPGFYLLSLTSKNGTTRTMRLTKTSR